MDGPVRNPLRPSAADARAIGRALDDGSRRLRLNKVVEVFVYEPTPGAAFEGSIVKENRAHLAQLRRVAGDDWQHLDAASVDRILGVPDAPEDLPPPEKRRPAFRWNGPAPRLPPPPPPAK